MTILLVLPAGEHVRETRERPRVLRRVLRRFSVLPLTVVAALTPPEPAVRIVDENVEALCFDTDCDLVGITFMTALAPRAYEIAAEFRRRGKIAVAGGYHATLCPEEAAEHFDALVVGDAEGAWERVVEDVAAAGLRKVYSSSRTFGAGLLTAPWARPSGLPIRNNPGDLRSDPVRGQETCAQHEFVLRTPFPRRELLRRTARHYVTTNAVQAGRGWTHGCRYCSVTAFHQRTYRHRSVAEVVAELREVPRNFMFVDDNIIGDVDFARELFRAMAPLGKRWVSQSSIQIADDPALLQLARAAGWRGKAIAPCWWTCAGMGSRAASG